MELLKPYLIFDGERNVKKIDTIVFDKTGTVTDGILNVKKIIASRAYSEMDILRFAAGGEYLSEHPVGKAIVSYSRKMKIDLQVISGFQSHAGFGISFIYEGHKIVIGKYELVKDILSPVKRAELSDKIEPEELNVFVVMDNEPIGIITLSDSLKEDSIQVISKFNSMGIDTILLSGDNELRTKIAANKLNVNQFFADIKPEGKLQIIADLQKKGKCVGMVGDGINDAPALTQADVSMAFNSGTDAAINSSHITLTKNDLNSVYNSITISNKTMNIIKQNLFWAFFYNIVCIPIAAGAFVSLGITMNPSFAALAMAFSSVSVVSNSLRIKQMDLYDTK